MIEELAVKPLDGARSSSSFLHSRLSAQPSTTTWFERKPDLFLGAYFMAL